MRRSVLTKCLRKTKIDLLMSESNALYLVISELYSSLSTLEQYQVQADFAKCKSCVSVLNCKILA